jgi:hypothetical protein
MTSSGLEAVLELESDTVEIYDRSGDGFQYSLKGSVELSWISDLELLLREARIDFMGYAVMLICNAVFVLRNFFHGRQYTRQWH